MKYSVLRATGTVYLTSAILLLTIISVSVSAISLYFIAQSESVQWNNTNSALAARTDLSTAIKQAQLLHAPAWDNSLPLNVLSTLSQISNTPIIGAEITSALLSETGSEGMFTYTSKQSLVRFPLLINLPPAPLLIHDSLHALAEFHLYVPPSGAHPLWSLAVWSNSEINLQSAPRFTCTELTIHAHMCEVNAISYGTVKKSDIKDKDNALPANASHYLFASDIDKSTLTEFKSIAWTQTNSCHSLPVATPFIWIDGDCEIPSSTSIGSPSSPVLMIVQNGDLQLHANARIYGLVLSIREHTMVTQRVVIAPDAAIVGSLVLNHPASANSKIQVRYDFSVLETLRSQPALQQIALIPGSVG